jgi:RND family efflux transporter MFP subunit
MNRRIRFGVAATLVASGCFHLAGCTQPRADVPPAAAVTVTVSHPVEREVTDYADFTARTAAIDSVEVRARVSGYLDQINFTEGALVSQGDVLFVIDPRPFVAERNRAQAQLEQARASVTASTAQLGDAEARESRAKAALDYAKARLDRTQRLREQNAVTKDVLDLHQSEWLEAQADLEGSRAQVGTSRAAISVAEAGVASAEAALAIAELNLQYTRVLAPITGRISRMLVTQGNLVQSSDLGGGTHLTTIVSVDPMYAYFDVHERTVLRVKQLIREGKAGTPDETEIPLWLGLADEEGYPHVGRVNFIDNQVNPRTGTLKVRGVFPNENEALLPGYFARVRVPIGTPHNALLVTERAIDTDQGQRVVYVVDGDDRVVSRPVRLGALHDGLREIIDGLKSGEQVVVNGLQQVRAGMTVETNIVPMPASTLTRPDSGGRDQTLSTVAEKDTP